MEALEQLTDWLWVAVAGIWLLLRLLGRRSRRPQTEPEPRTAPRPAPGEEVETFSVPSSDDDGLARPIEPR